MKKYTVVCVVVLFVILGCSKKIITKSNISEELPTIDHWKIEAYPLPPKPADSVSENDTLTASQILYDHANDSTLLAQFVHSVQADLHNKFQYVDYDNIINTGYVKIEITTYQQLIFDLPNLENKVQFVNQSAGRTGAKTSIKSTESLKTVDPNFRLRSKNKVVKVTLHLYNRALEPLGNITITPKDLVELQDQRNLTFSAKVKDISSEYVAEVIAKLIRDKSIQ